MDTDNGTTGTNNKQLMLEALRYVFVTRGYDGATLNHLAEACGLSKASLYHHFPGGKTEIAALLVRSAISELQIKAFAQLDQREPLQAQLEAFSKGFADYVDHGQQECLLSTFARLRCAGDDTSSLQVGIKEQFKDWHNSLRETFETAGAKPKKATRLAHEFLSALYGALHNSRLHDEPRLFRKARRRIVRAIASQLP